jgi:hypothetical protein
MTGDKLSAEQVQQNWNNFEELINKYISSPRKEKLQQFYQKFKERLILMPASSKISHHSAFPGGYIYHINKVCLCALKLKEIWSEMGDDNSKYTNEELIFSALNHDLGKMGDNDVANYLEQDNEWRKNNMGEIFKMNPLLSFMPVQDRSLFLLQQHGIICSFNEWTAIKTHDGLYSDSNKEYLMTYSPDQKPPSSISYILHQADLMAARIEFTQQYKIGEPKKEKTDFSKFKKSATKEFNNKPFKL